MIHPGYTVGCQCINGLGLAAVQSATAASRRELAPALTAEHSHVSDGDGCLLQA